MLSNAIAYEDTRVALYEIKGGADAACYSATNPHVSRTAIPYRFFSGPAVMKRRINSSQARNKQSARDESTAEFSILHDVSIPVGCWAVLTHQGSTTNGLVTKCDRTIPTLTAVTIDTSQVLPFSIAPSAPSIPQQTDTTPPTLQPA